MFDFVEVKETEKPLWEGFQAFSSTFVSSWDWIDFRKSIGVNVKKFFIYKDSILVGKIFFEIHKRKIANYAYAPYNPELSTFSVKNDLTKFLEEFKDFLKKFINDQKLNLVRFDPFLPSNLKLDFKKKFSYSLSPGHPKFYREIDLRKSEKELFLALSKTKRYIVKKAQEEGMYLSSKENNIEEFYKLINITSKKKGFSIEKKEYFENMFSILGRKGIVEILYSKINSINLSSALFIKFLDTVYYSYSGNTIKPVLSKKGGNYFLLWEAIKKYKKEGYKKLNLWGVLPDNYNRSHILSGVSDFKKSMGGTTKELVGVFECYNNIFKYTINKLYDLIIYRKDRI